MTTTTVQTNSQPIRTSTDVVLVRQIVRTVAVKIGLGLVDQTKVVTAASELARNTLDYGKGGDVHVEEITDGYRKGMRLTFVDQGPGIVDLDKALTDGYTTGGGLGMGLSGSRRLMSEFTIKTAPGEGTTIIATKWK